MAYVEVTCVCCGEPFQAKNNHILPSHCKKLECQAFKRKKSIERIRQRQKERQEEEAKKVPCVKWQGLHPPTEFMGAEGNSAAFDPFTNVTPWA